MAEERKKPKRNLLVIECEPALHKDLKLILYRQDVTIKNWLEDCLRQYVTEHRYLLPDDRQRVYGSIRRKLKKGA